MSFRFKRQEVMKRTHARKRPQKVAIALGAVLAAAGCATAPSQNTAAPTDQSSRYDGGVEQLLTYCGKLRDSGELLTAAGICERAHNLAPADPRPLMALGEIFAQMEQLPLAANAYLTVLEQTPHKVDARYLLGKTYIAMGRHDLALQELKFALTQSPEDARIYNALGIANGMLGNQVAARQAFENGLKVAPNDVPLRNNLGLAMVLGGQHEEGIAVLQAVAVDPAASATSIRNLRLAEGIAQSANNKQMTAEAQSAAKPGASQLASTGTIPAEFGNDPEPVISEAREETPATAVIPSPQPSSAAPASVPREPVMLTEALSSPTDSIQLADGGAPAYLDNDPSAEEPIGAIKADGDTDSESVAASSAEEGADGSATDDQSAAAQSEKTGSIDSDEMVVAGRQSDSAADTSEDLSLNSMPQPVLVPEHELPAGEAPTPTAEMQPVITANVSPAKSPMAAPVMTQTAALGGDNIYSVQLASYRSADRAQDGWRQIRAGALDLLQDVDPVIRRSDLGPEKGIYFRLRTKPSSKTVANQLCSALQARGLSCLTIQEDPAAVEETAMPTAAKS